MEDIVFIAGPYFGDGSYEVIESNIEEAERYAIALANYGIFFFCPHLHTRHFEVKSEAEEAFFKALDLLILSKCSALVALPRWRESSGARHEVDIFIKDHKPVFFMSSLKDIDQVVEWFKSRETKLPPSSF